MFRPPPVGGPPRQSGPFPGHSPGGSGGPSFGPPQFQMHGRGGFQAPFHGGPYHGFSPSQPHRPPPPPGSPPYDTPPPPPPAATDSEGNFRSTSKPAPPPPPPVPKDPEMLKNIEVLSSFVVKNGPQFESMARAKQAGDPKFSFLFGGDKGTEAALGFDFYNWKKEHLSWVEERSKALPADPQRLVDSNPPGKFGRGGVSRFSPVEPPASPAGSDMDMEDDFTLPAQAGNTDVDKIFGIPSTEAERKLASSPPARKRQSLSPAGRDGRLDLFRESFDVYPQVPVSTPDRKPPFSSLDPADLKSGSSLSSAGDRQASLKGASRGFSAQPLVDRAEKVADDREAAPSEMPRRRRDTRRRTGFDRPCMENISPQASPSRADYHKEMHRKETLRLPDFDEKVSSPNGHWEAGTRHSRWGPEGIPSDRLGSLAPPQSTVVDDQGAKKSDFAPNREENILVKDRSRSPEVAAKLSREHDDHDNKDSEKTSKSRSDPPAVDEFGRLVRKGSTDSDDDDAHVSRSNKRRRTSSRSRSGSRSPAGGQGKHYGSGSFPHWRGRRSGSWSRSPRRNSHTPPREGRWGGEGRGDRGVRRGGRGTASPCFDFLKGKCFRSSCRFSHEESNEGAGNHGGRWSGGGRGRGRGQGHAGKESGEESERNWGSGQSADSKTRRAWESDEQNEQLELREMQLIDEFQKQGKDTSGGESVKQDNKNPEIQSTVELRQADENQKAKTDSESCSMPGAPTSSLPASVQSQSVLSAVPVSGAVPKLAVLPISVVSKHMSGFSGSSPSAALQLGSFITTSIPQPLSYMVSPTPNSQQLQFSSPPPSLSHQPVFSSPMPMQQPVYRTNVGARSQTMSFPSSNSLQQPAFSAPQNIFSANAPPPSLQASFSARPMGFPQPSFNALHPPNFTPFSNSNDQGSMQFRQPPPMLGSPQIQTLPPRSGMSPWMPPVSNPPGQAPQSLHLPVSQSLHPPALQPPLYPLVLPLQPPLQPLHPPPQSLQQPLPLAPPSQESAAPAVVFPYSMPLSYPLASFSTLSSRPVLPPLPFNNDQYDPLADSLEPAPPGSGSKNGPVANNQISSQENALQQSVVESWRHHTGNMSAPLMTNAGEVVLENVSPGLPGHMDNVALGNDPRSQARILAENLSPTNVRTSSKENIHMIVGGLQGRGTIEVASPTDQNPSGVDLQRELSKAKEQKKKEKDGHVLNLIRKAVAEHVKDLLKPTWKEGQISKDSFKTIAKKAVDKIMGALAAKGQIPKSQEKLDLYMLSSKPKIAKLVQGYVDKYVKT